MSVRACSAQLLDRMVWWLRVAAAQIIHGRLGREGDVVAGPGHQVVPHAPLRQPDATTCGSSVLVMARMLNDPAVAERIVQGTDAATLFREASLAMHRTTCGPRDVAGRLQLPWPAGLGTSPWGAARQMSAGSGVPGTRYAVDVIDPARAGTGFDRVAAAARSGHAVPLYVGNARLPRHVVLVTEATDDALTVYEPAAGVATTIGRRGFETGRLRLAGWDHPWLAVVPR